MEEEDAEKKNVKTEEKRENVLKRRQGSGKYYTVEDKHRLRGKSKARRKKREG